LRCRKGLCRQLGIACTPALGQDVGDVGAGACRPRQEIIAISDTNGRIQMALSVVKATLTRRDQSEVPVDWSGTAELWDDGELSGVPKQLCVCVRSGGAHREGKQLRVVAGMILQPLPRGCDVISDVPAQIAPQQEALEPQAFRVLSHELVGARVLAA
jgi:hypothetical protein